MTAIEWTDVTWNPVRGCSRVSPGCENCYAERQAARPILSAPGKPYHGLVTVRSQASGLRYESPGAAGSWTAPRWTGKVVFDPEALAAPLKWKKPRRVFVNSMSDLFHESLTDEEIAAVFGVMAATPHHTYQVLTKRAERMVRWFEWHREQRIRRFDFSGSERRICEDEAMEHLPDLPAIGSRALWPLRNVWIGVSVEDQQRADERIPHLLRVPAAVRFLSIEPMLERIDLTTITLPNEIAAEHRLWVARINCLTEHDDDHYLNHHAKVDWVIVGGESGPGARPCSVEWIRSIVSQCVAADVPVFVKQLGGVAITDSDDDRRFAGDMNLPHPFRIHLSDRKGADPSEWPEDLRVREFPEATP